MAFCNCCGSQNNDYDKFCLSCGARIGEAPSPLGGGVVGGDSNMRHPCPVASRAPSGNIPDMRVWSILATLLCSLLAAPSIYFAFEAQKSIDLEDFAMAAKHTKTSKNWIIWPLVISAAIVFFTFVLGIAANVGAGLMCL